MKIINKLKVFIEKILLLLKNIEITKKRVLIFVVVVIASIVSVNLSNVSEKTVLSTINKGIDLIESDNESQILEDKVVAKDNKSKKDDQLFLFTDDEIKNSLVIPLTTYGESFPKELAIIIKILEKEKLLYKTIKGIRGPGWIKIDGAFSDNLTDYTVKKLFNNFVMQDFDKDVFDVILGRGLLKFTSKDISKDIIKALENKSLAKYFIYSKDFVALNLGAMREEVPENDLAMLYSFVSHFSDFFASSKISISEELEISLYSLEHYFHKGLYDIFIELLGHNKLEDFVSKLKPRGALITIPSVFKLMPKQAKQVLDNLNSMTITVPIQEKNGAPFLAFKVPEVVSPEDFFPKLAFINKIGKDYVEFKTHITLPVTVRGSKFHDYLQNIAKLHQENNYNDLLSKGSSVDVFLNLKVGSKSILSKDFLDVIDSFDVDKYFYESLYKSSGVKSFVVDLNNKNIDSDKIRIITNALSYIAKDLKNSLFNSLSLKIESDTDVKGLVLDEKLQKLNAKYVKGAIVIPFEISSILLFQEVLKEYASNEEYIVSLAGELEFLFKDLDNEYLKHLVWMLHTDLGVYKTIDFIRGIKGKAKVMLYPNTEKLLSKEFQNNFTKAYKFNDKVKNEFKDISSVFKFKIPQDYSSEVQDGTLRAFHNFIYADGDKELRKQRVENAVKFIMSRRATKTGILPNDLGGLLEVVSDKRKISEVLDERAKAQ